MRTISISAFFALAGMFGFAGFAEAAQAQAQAQAIAYFSADDEHGHNDSEPDNEDPVTNNGPNKVTPRIDSDERTAEGLDD